MKKAKVYISLLFSFNLVTSLRVSKKTCCYSTKIESKMTAHKICVGYLKMITCSFISVSHDRFFNRPHSDFGRRGTTKKCENKSLKLIFISIQLCGVGAERVNSYA